ncbi:MAG: uroporphyrinogen-III synthase [Deltaproteobacteria bacterium]|nr:uroporphyrinogen-III synthase [Deltaproteobacteria bacterium]
MALHETGSGPMQGKEPLRGRRIVVTRARAQGEDFAREIEKLGGEVVEFPAIEIVPAQSYERLDAAIQRLNAYHWVIFTSVNGVEHFWARLRKLGVDGQEFSRLKIAAIGPKTAEALAACGVKADLVPREYRAEAILRELGPQDVEGRRVLLPRAAKARDILPETLREWGAEVDEIEAYRTVAANSDSARLRQELRANKIDMVTFTSSSTVSYFAALFPQDAVAELLARTAVACIGPITEKTAREVGIRVDVVAEQYTVPGLTRAIVEYFKRQQAKGNS